MAASLNLGRGPERGALLEDVDLVIFDFDGVIVDSETLSLSTLQTALHKAGIEMSLKDVRAAFLGKSLASILDFLAKKRPGTCARDFADDWETALFAAFRTDLRAMADLAQLLDLLTRRNIATCIASSSTLTRIGVALRAVEMQDRFAHIFSSEQVAHGKPAPDLFLHAAACMDAAPARCLVIEDSPSGVRAAARAGMRSIAFLGGAHLEALRPAHAAELRALGAERAFSSFSDVIRAL